MAGSTVNELLSGKKKLSFPAECSEAARGEGNPTSEVYTSPNKLGPLPSHRLTAMLAGDDNWSLNVRF
jgi:hypothetical protein